MKERNLLLERAELSYLIQSAYNQANALRLLGRQETLDTETIMISASRLAVQAEELAKVSHLMHFGVAKD